MLKLITERAVLGLFLALVVSLSYCRPPKGNLQLSSNPPTIIKTIKQVAIFPVNNKEETVTLNAISLNGLPLTFRVAELVRALGQPDSIVIPTSTCFQEGEIFRQYCYGTFSCMTFGNLAKVASAPRVVEGLVQQINFNQDIQLKYKGHAIDKHTSLADLKRLFPSKSSEAQQNGLTMLRVPVINKENRSSVGFYFKENRLVKFTHFSPCS